MVAFRAEESTSVALDIAMISYDRISTAGTNDQALSSRSTTDERCR